MVASLISSFRLRKGFASGDADLVEILAHRLMDKALGIV